MEGDILTEALMEGDILTEVLMEGDILTVDLKVEDTGFWLQEAVGHPVVQILLDQGS